MSSDFLKAAASFYGMPGPCSATWGVDQSGRLVLVVELPVSDEDMPEIAERMRTMRADKVAMAHTSLTGVDHAPSDVQMRDEYNSLRKTERSSFGSFVNYRNWRLGQVMGEGTQPIEIPAHVYLSPAEATDQQKAMAVGRDEKGNYAIAPEDLTEVQRAHHVALGNLPGGPQGEAADRMRAEYVARTVAARERLSGADGKPTSNADDFGGVPG